MADSQERATRGQRDTDRRAPGGRSGRHRRAYTIGGTVVGLGMLVGTALVTDMTSWLAETGRRAVDRDQLVVSIGDGESGVAWLIPDRVTAPFAAAGEPCGQTWPALGTIEGAVSAANEWRVDVTGIPHRTVMIHSITPKIIDRDPIPDGSTVYVCPVGGGSSERVASLDLTSPGDTEYWGADAPALRGLSYQLTPEEHGTFYVAHRDQQVAQSIYRFELVMEYSDELGTHEVNLNELAGREPFVSVESCGVPVVDVDSPAAPSECP